MDILYYNSFAGISGDMNLAAMIDLGVPSEYLISEMEKLNVSGFQIEVSSALKMGISGTQVNVKLESEEHPHSHGHSHGHGHGHSHHRTFRKIKELINTSQLSDEVKATSIDIFEKVAIAEGKIHNKPAEDVHFHEVGAVDSIVDIVGASICYHYLKPTKVICSTIELGGGFVNCAHGKFPVPAPATTEIVKGLPVKIGTVQTETTTPTGAAILATLVDEFTDMPNFSITKTAYGIGHKNMDIPNVLRVHLADSKQKGTLNYESATLIECNIDDMPAEEFDFVMERLFKEGAQDVYFTPIMMKKTRPATKISVLCKTSEELKFTDILLKETTTLGVRSFEVKKSMLDRKIELLDTKFGAIEVKSGIYDGQVIKVKPEYDQCKKAAEQNNVSLQEVMNEIRKITNK